MACVNSRNPKGLIAGFFSWVQSVTYSTMYLALES